MKDVTLLPPSAALPLWLGKSENRTWNTEAKDMWLLVKLPGTCGKKPGF